MAGVIEAVHQVPAQSYIELPPVYPNAGPFIGRLTY
jgi:hypothetical protein